MTDLLLALHFIGLMMGAGGGFGGTIAQRVAAKRPPEQAAVLRSLGPAMAQFSGIGLIVMLTTGVALVFARHGGFDGLAALFWIKMIFVTTLTLASLAVHILYARLKAGDAGAAKRLALFGPISGASALLATIFAAFAFH